MKRIILCVFIILIAKIVLSQTIYINAKSGDDKNSGSELESIKTLEEGINRVNNYSGNEPLILKIEPGLYSLSKNLTINYNNSFTDKNRLIIEASIMPDDTNWTHVKMPVVISTSLPQSFSGDYCTYSLNIETSHVTVKGIKFLGNPSLNTKHFCIYRSVDTLRDLNISQCMFIGDQDMMPVQVAVLTNGHGTEIDHCVFSGCRWAAIYFYAEGWKVPINNSSMHHCIITDGFMGAIWTSLVNSDFQFFNNIISGCDYFWIKNYFNEAIYTLSNCIITNVGIYNGEWQKENGKVQGNYRFIEDNCIKKGDIHLIKLDKSKPFDVPVKFMHIAKDSLGHNLNAGIFLNN